ncbi:membrane protein insertase YidC [Myxococcota bacterium]|nr:membrane protein insertase YidC [Myxococcota bacterium]
MDRNNLVAFALSMLVFAGYLMYQEQRRDEMQLATESTASAVSAQASDPSSAEQAQPSSPAVAAQPLEAPAPVDEAETASSPVAPPAVPAAEIPAVVHTLKSDDVVARISNGPGLIESWSLVHYDERLAGGAVPIDLVEADQALIGTELSGVRMPTRFEVVHVGVREIVQRAESEAGVLMRTLRLDETGYGFDVELAFDSRLPAAVDAGFELLWPASISKRADFNEVSLLAYGAEDGVTRTLVAGLGKAGFLGFGGTPDGKQVVESDVQWAGFDVPYFTGVLMDPEARDRIHVVFEATEATVSARARMSLPSVSVPPGGSTQAALRGFLGPKDPAALERVAASLAHSVNRGWSWLEPLTRFFEIALEWLYRYIPNYGLAIIVLTIIVRLVTAPLMMNQMRSAERMRAVQPKMKALQERYKDDRQRQSEELMKLYREEGINPLGGCLPLLLQFPVLVGLFYALRSSIGLRHAHFFSWIDDLSQPDLLFTLPGVDFPVRLLPLLMGASMYVQQKMTPTTGMDPAQARMMLVMMPAMMLLISYTFPSGLVLYWTVSNLLGIGHQSWIRRQTRTQS